MIEEGRKQGRKEGRKRTRLNIGKREGTTPNTGPALKKYNQDFSLVPVNPQAIHSTTPPQNNVASRSQTHRP
jgi:hypothetical protein